MDPKFLLHTNADNQPTQFCGITKNFFYSYSRNTVCLTELIQTRYLQFKPVIKSTVTTVSSDGLAQIDDRP